MSVKVVITGGGTGGHVYPALSVIRFLQSSPSRPRAADPLHDIPASSGRSEQAAEAQGTAGRAGDEWSLVYVGNARGMERELVPRAGIPCYLFPMAPPTSLRGLVLLALATVRTALVLLRTRPAVTFATGGYVSAPVSLASWMLRIPLVLFLPDVVPGKAVAWLVPLARRIAVSTEDALASLPADKVSVTGYPVRESFGHTSRAAGREHLGLPADATVLCVFGGSQGARSINQALSACLPDLLTRYHVVHVCGPQRLAEAQAAAANLPADHRARYHLYGYLHDQEMADALAAADLAVCRSGASVLGELPAAGTPAVLVPFPDPAVHQEENAEYLVRQGAAVALRDEDLLIQLGEVLEGLLSDRERLGEMGGACSALARPQAAAKIAAMIREAAA